MADREKVIEILEKAKMVIEKWIPMFEQYNTPAGIDDAILLLKEQEVKTQGADSGMCEICSFYERALPVKPHYNSRTNWYECGACHYSMTSGMICRSELIPACKVGFCAKCGKAVKWE